jgi:hypothetical protein
LAAACSENSLDSEAGFELCRDACMKAESCWKVSSCSSTPECSQYAANCGKLVARLEDDEKPGSSGTFISLPPSNLDQICGTGSIMTNAGYKSCEDNCLKARCCWKTGADPSCSDTTNCPVWADCAVLNQATVPPVSSDPNLSPTEAPQTTTPAATGEEVTLKEIYDACYNHDNNIGSGTSLCETLCEKGACCFQDASTCAAVDCSVFEPCGVVHDAGNTAADVEEACSDEGDRSDCVALCSEVTCCFTSDVLKICEFTNPGVVCEEYTACEVLYQAELENNP